MKFYDCKPAPSPRRVRVFMAEKGIEIPTVQVDLRNGEHLQPEFRMINPHCTVPVLVLDDGTRLISTAAIWRYLEETHPEPPLMGRTAKEKALIADTQWRIESEGLAAVGDGLRNSAPGMKGRAVTGPAGFEQIPALAERGRKRAEIFLQLLEFMVGPKPFLCGDTYSVADIDAMIAVDFAKWIKLELPPDAVNARRWYASVSSRPSAKA
jgi:glutathione S-transferase